MVAPSYHNERACSMGKNKGTIYLAQHVRPSTTGSKRARIVPDVFTPPKTAQAPRDGLIK